MSKIEQNKFDSLKHNLNFDDISDKLAKFKDSSNSNNLDFLNIDKNDLNNQLLQLLVDLGIDISNLDSDQLESLLQLLNCHTDDIKVDLKQNNNFDINQILNNQLYLNLCNHVNFIMNDFATNHPLKDKLDSVNNMIKHDPNQLIDLINQEFGIKESNLTDALTNAILSSHDKNFQQTEFLLLISVAVAAKNAATINNIIVNNPELNFQFKESLNKRKNEEKAKINNLNKIIEQNKKYNK